MTKDAVFAAIDAGTTKTMTLIGRREPSGGVALMGAGLAPSAGMLRGAVADAQAARAAVHASYADAVRTAGVAPTTAFVTVSGPHVEAAPSWGAIHSQRQDAPLTPADLQQAMRDAVPQGWAPSRIPLHLTPRTYAVDGMEGVRNPVGMHALRLDVETLCVSAAAAPVDALLTAVEGGRLRVAGLVAAPVADFEAVLTPAERAQGAVVMDIGGGVTTIAVIRQGQLWAAAVLPLGANHFTSDLSVALDITMQQAEEIKLRYGKAVMEGAGDSVVEVEADGGAGRSRVEVRTIVHYLHERALELFRMAGWRLQQMGAPTLPPGGLALTGGGANLRGMERVARLTLGAPVRVAAPAAIDGLPEGLRDPAYAASIGTLLWGARHPQGEPNAQAARQAQFTDAQAARQAQFNARYSQANAGPLKWLRGRMSRVAS